MNRAWFIDIPAWGIYYPFSNERMIQFMRENVFVVWHKDRSG